MSHLNKNFLTALETLYMSDSSSLVFKNEQPDNPYLVLHMHEALKFDPDAIYFKQFENKPPIPQIYIYDCTQKPFSDVETSSLHRNLWNSGQIPLIFLITTTEVKIYNCYEKPNVDSNGNIQKIEPMEVLNLLFDISDKIDKFRANKFDLGLFWEEEYANNFRYNQTAYESLLKELTFSRKFLIEKNILSKSTTESLIIKSILLKYLDEREVFEVDYWKKFNQNASCFSDLFTDPTAIVNLFDDLKLHFNGGIFNLSDEEKNDILSSVNLREFGFFLDGKKDGKQLLLWRLYSFKYLPVELISNIYEIFLSGKKGVVYTPPILVDLIIDEVLPLDTFCFDPKIKVLDPACGSGVFLVSAYKRLVLLWQKQNNWQKPSLEILKQILRENIYGIDIERGSVQLSVFSLSLTLCDALSPNVIWNELRFDNLQSSGNLIQKDFFEWIQEPSNTNCFDIVVGNPPFVEELETVPAQEINKALKKVRKLPQNQLSYLFLEQCSKITKPNGITALIQPSGILYNQQAKSYRNFLFRQQELIQVFDFSGVKNLFNIADVTVAVLFFRNTEVNKNDEISVLHITVRQTYSAQEKIYFDLNHYDFHLISYEELLTNDTVWKCNLIGGGRTKQLLNRLEYMRTLKEFLKSKESKGWIYQEGYIVSKPVYQADYITGQPHLPANAFTKNGIEKSKIIVENNKWFQRIKDKRIYEPPHIIIKEQISKEGLYVEFSNEYLTFKNTMVGIHAPKHELESLLNLNENLKQYSSLMVFYILAKSGRIGIYKATSTLLTDLEILPYPEDIEDLATTTAENILINDAIIYYFDLINGNKKLEIFSTATVERDVKAFQKTYCDILNTVYNNFIPHDIYETESFYICLMKYGNDEVKLELDFSSDTQIDKSLKKVLDIHTTSIRFKKIMKFYHGNFIVLIKPKQLRFWLKSIAILDADESFNDLIMMGY